MFINIIILGLVSFFGDISSEMVYPLIPYFLIYVLGIKFFYLGIIEGLAESVASLLKVFFGYYSDRIKKRKIFAFYGYTLSGIGKLLLALASSFGTVLSSRFVDRVGKGIRTAPRDALISESAQPEKQGAAFGLHRSMDTAGAIIGSILAFYFFSHLNGNIRHIFYLALIPAILSVLVLLFVRDIPLKKKNPNLIKTKLKFKISLLPKQLKIFLLISFIFTIGNSSNLFLILKSLQIGFLPVMAILLYIVYNISYTLVSYPMAKLSDKIGRRNLLALSYFLYGLVYLAFAFTTVKIVYWFLFVIYGFYSGISEGIAKAFVADNSPEDLKGSSLGIHSTVIGVTLLPASILAGFLWQFVGASAPFYFSGLTGFISTILLIKYIK